MDMYTANSTNDFDVHAWIQRGPPTTPTITTTPIPLPAPEPLPVPEPLPFQTPTWHYGSAYPPVGPALTTPFPAPGPWTPHANDIPFHGTYPAIHPTNHGHFAGPYPPFPPTNHGHLEGPQTVLSVRRRPSPTYSGYSSSGHSQQHPSPPRAAGGRHRYQPYQRPVIPPPAPAPTDPFALDDFAGWTEADWQLALTDALAGVDASLPPVPPAAVAPEVPATTTTTTPPPPPRERAVFPQAAASPPRRKKRTPKTGVDAAAKRAQKAAEKAAEKAAKKAAKEAEKAAKKAAAPRKQPKKTKKAAAAAAAAPTAPPPNLSAAAIADATSTSTLSAPHTLVSGPRGRPRKVEPAWEMHKGVESFAPDGAVTYLYVAPHARQGNRGHERDFRDARGRRVESLAGRCK